MERTTDHHERTRVGDEQSRITLHFHKSDGAGGYQALLRDVQIETINGKPVWLIGTNHTGEQWFPWDRVIHLDVARKP